MASRRDIRTALYEELERLVGDRANVTADYPTAEQEPASVYYEGNERPVLNGVGDQKFKIYDNQERVIREVYVDHYQYVADVSLMVDDDTLEEELYGELRDGLKKWTHRAWPYGDFHNHCENFEVSETSDSTSSDVYSIMRGDTFNLVIGYVDGIPKDVDYIESIRQNGPSGKTTVTE